MKKIQIWSMDQQINQRQFLNEQIIMYGSKLNNFLQQTALRLVYNINIVIILNSYQEQKCIISNTKTILFLLLFYRNVHIINYSQMTDSSRDIQVALKSLKQVLSSLKIAQNQPQHQSEQQINGSLKKVLQKIRVSKLSDVFLQKLSRSNMFTPATYHHLQSQKQIDQARTFKLKGISINPQIISCIYVLDIIFCLVTFVTSSFRAFIDVFKQNPAATSGVYAGLMIAAIFATSLKIVVNCITKKIQDGILLVYLSDILLNELKSRSLYIDILYVISNIALLVANNDSSPLSAVLFIISIIKLFSLYDNLRTFQTTFINNPMKEQYFNLLKVIFFNIFFAHFVASILLAMSLINKEQNWKVVKGINEDQWWVQYIWAYYWACTIIMTVGFGDITAYYFYQAIILAFIQLSCCIVLAYNISEIGNIIKNIRQSQTEFRSKIAIFRRMAKQNQIEQQLQRRIQGYLREETQIKQTFQFNKQNQLLAEIPENLRNQYIIQANKILFPDLPFFKNLQRATLIKFTEKLTGKVYYPGEYLLKLQQNNQSIMILKNGKVGLAYKKYGSYLNGTIVQQVQIVVKQVLTPQGHFIKKIVPILLNTDFLSKLKKINYDIIAQSYSFVYDITYENYFSAINQSEIDSAYYFSIRHKHAIVQNQWEQLVCEYCSKQEDLEQVPSKSTSKYQSQSKTISKLDVKKYHTKFACPKLHYFPLTGVAILKNIRHHGKQQHRDQGYFRKRQRQNTCLMIRKPFFKIYEETCNLCSRRRKIPFQKQESKGISLGFLPWMGKSNEVEVKKDDDKLQHFLTIQRIVRESIEQALTGYKPQFWQLQMDRLHNYSNYFPLDNSSNLDFVKLRHGRHQQLHHGDSSVSGREEYGRKTMLNIIRELEEQNGKEHRERKFSE